MATENEILQRVHALVESEHELRAKLASGQLSAAEEHDRLRDTEVALDQCWDLLRQRRARQENGQNPDDARPRSAREVEGYSG